MEVVNLVGGDRRPPKQRQSYVSEYTVLGRAGGPVFPLHQPIICGRGAERNTIPVVIRAHADECAGPRDKTIEVVNVRKLHIRSGRLIVAAILVEPWNGVRLSAAIRRSREGLGLLTGCPLHQQSRTAQLDGSQEGPSTPQLRVCEP